MLASIPTRRGSRGSRGEQGKVTSGILKYPLKEGDPNFAVQRKEYIFSFLLLRESDFAVFRQRRWTKWSCHKVEMAHEFGLWTLEAVTLHSGSMPPCSLLLDLCVCVSLLHIDRICEM